MARIRTVKPEFWTSEQIAECSPNARLLFIGLWNFCDDYGVHQASEVRLKMEVFPSDSFGKEDVRRMMDELIANGLVEEYEIDGLRYWFVTGWDKHQKPDTKTGKYPRPDGSIGTKIRRKDGENSPNNRRIIAERSPTEKEKEKEKERDNAREENNSRPNQSTLPENFSPDQQAITMAKTAGLDLDAELEKFRLHYEASGEVKARWGAQFRKWLLHAQQHRADADKRNHPAANQPVCNPDRMPPGLKMSSHGAYT